MFRFARSRPFTTALKSIQVCFHLFYFLIVGVARLVDRLVGRVISGEADDHGKYGRARG